MSEKFLLITRLREWIGEDSGHPLARERRELARRLEGRERADRDEIIGNCSAELYASWILEPYPGEGDLTDDDG